MALVRLATPVAGTTIDPDTHFKTEFDNIYNNALALISPLTGTLNAGNNQITNHRLENVAATPSGNSLHGRTVWHSTFRQLQLVDGTQIRVIPALYQARTNRVVIATSPSQFGEGPVIATTSGSCIWPAHNAAATISTTISFTGAVTTDRVIGVSHTAVTAASVILSGRVTSADTITVALYNGTGAVYNPGSGTLTVTLLQT